MLDRRDFPTKTTDMAVVDMIAKAETEEVATVWDRLEAMEPQCGFGDIGLSWIIADNSMPNILEPVTDARGYI